MPLKYFDFIAIKSYLSVGSPLFDQRELRPGGRCKEEKKKKKKEASPWFQFSFKADIQPVEQLSKQGEERDIPKCSLSTTPVALKDRGIRH